MNIRSLLHTGAIALAMLGLTACGGGGGGGGNPAAEGTNTDSGCTGFCATNSPANLTVADVGTVISRAVQEANARGALATIAVTDRVGNVLALFRMNGAATTFTIQSGIVNSNSGLENIAVVPSDLAAIAKAISGSYLASEGNAFSTRVASQIVEEHFNPHEIGAPGGPLFGVQFSQLPCSDLVQGGAGVGVGPQRSPLGLSADPGGFPLYKNGHPVGGIGVIADGIYGLDRNILDTDTNLDEVIALAGTFGYSAPVDRLADSITVDGRTLRYSDVGFANLLSVPASAPAYAAIVGGAAGQGVLIDDNAALAANVQNYFSAAGGILAGSTFGAASSGIEPADTISPGLYPGLDAFVLTDGAGTNRYPPLGGVAIGGNELTAGDVTQIIRSALGVANMARGQIRRPLGSQARVTVSVVDTAGNILGIARTRDAPLFGTDVSLQKARTATFFSSTDAAGVLTGTPDADQTPTLPYVSSISDYVTAVQSFVGAGALTDGTAFADRSGGNLSRPFYPDGIDGNPNGPFSKAFSVDPAANLWSPFSTGLQLDLVYNQLIGHLAIGNNVTNCTQIGSTRLANGIQIFPGSVPIYRNGVLVGGIGVSGDGIEQDDMISFLGTYNASIALGTANGIGDGAIIGNAPIAMRADQLTLLADSNKLRYIQCPQNPFLNSNQQNVCDGK